MNTTQTWLLVAAAWFAVILYAVALYIRYS